MWLPPWTSVGAMGVQSSQWCQWVQRGGPLSHNKLRVAHASSSTKYEDAVKALMASSVWVQNPKLQCWFQKTWLSHYKVYKKKKKKLKELSTLEFCGWGKLTTDVSILNKIKFCDNHTPFLQFPEMGMGIPLWKLHSWCEHKQWTGETKSSLQVCLPSPPQK